MKKKKQRYRTIWISDLHLGTSACKAEKLLKFLKRHDCETFFLVGDIIDGWRLKQSWNWPQSHNDVVQEIMRKAKAGTNVIYVPGNHDEFARTFAGTEFGQIHIEHDWVHVTVDGRKLLVTHGDQYDRLIQNHRWLGMLGTRAYAWLSILDVPINRLCERLKVPGWSLASYVKEHARDGQILRNRLRDALLLEASDRGLDGVICGHVHHPEIVEIDSLIYCNDGDWVKNCSALVETFAGRLEIII